MLRTAIVLTILIALGSLGASALTAATAGDFCANINWAMDAARYSALSTRCGR